MADESVKVLDTITNNIITALKTDAVLNGYPFLTEIGVNPSNDAPCFTIELDDDDPAPVEHSGGYLDNYKTKCRIIVYIPATGRETSLPSLNEFRKRIEKKITDSQEAGTLSSYITASEYKGSYKQPLRIPGGNYMDAIAFIGIINFEFYYEVSL